MRSLTESDTNWFLLLFNHPISSFIIDNSTTLIHETTDCVCDWLACSVFARCCSMTGNKTLAFIRWNSFDDDSTHSLYLTHTLICSLSLSCSLVRSPFGSVRSCAQSKHALERAADNWGNKVSKICKILSPLSHSAPFALSATPPPHSVFSL